jgi:hypothetical protein
MFKCPNSECAIHIKDKLFPAMMDCPICDFPLIKEILITPFHKEVIERYPYVIAYPYQQMLEESAGRNQLEFLAYTFNNVLKYLGLLCASEYFNSKLRLPLLNDLFRNNLYQPSFGSWNQFIRESIKELNNNQHNWIFPEINKVYENLETQKNVKRYKTPSACTNEDGQISWRESLETAIGTLINFRNKNLGHSVPKSKEVYAEIYNQYSPVLDDLLQGIVPLTSLSMYKAERFNIFSLIGTNVSKIEGIKPPQNSNGEQIWLQKEERTLNLLPFYVLPGNFADTQGDPQVFVYEQNTSKRLVFFSPESIVAESSGEVLERLNLLLHEKEKEEPIIKNQLSRTLIKERIQFYNEKTRNGLIKERKIIDGTYQNREEQEQGLKSWTGALAGLFVISAQAGSGKTNLLAHIERVYNDRNFDTILLRANRLQTTNLESALKDILNLEDAIQIEDVLAFYTQSNPLILLIDGGNEHTEEEVFLENIIAVAKKHKGGALKMVLSWRATTLQDLPIVDDIDDVLYAAAAHKGHEHLPAKYTMLLTPLNREELEKSWKNYKNHSSKKYKPQFSLSELTILDRPLTEQLKNPLLLRMFLELFNNKSIKQKGKGFTDIWELWWKKLTRNERESSFLKELALLLIEKNTLQIPLDELYNHPALGLEIQNIQVDSAYQQLLNKGELSCYFKENQLLINFTMEAAFHYVLSHYLNENNFDKDQIKELLKQKPQWKDPVRYYLLNKVKAGQPDLLYQLIDEEEIGIDLLALPLAQALITIDIPQLLDGLLAQPSCRDWEVLINAVKIIEDAQQKGKLNEIAPFIFDKAINAEKSTFKLLFMLFDYLDIKKQFICIDCFKNHTFQVETLKDAELVDLIGGSFILFDELERSLEYFEKSLEIKLKIGADSKSIAQSYDNIGDFYSIENEDLAIEYYQKALTLRLESANYENSIVADSYIKIGQAWEFKSDDNSTELIPDLKRDESWEVRFNKKDNSKALDFYKKSLDINLKTLGTEHYNTIENYHIIGTAHEDSFQYDEAIFYYLKTMNSGYHDRLVGNDNIHFLKSYYKIIDLVLLMEDNKKALEYSKLQLELILKIPKGNHPDLIILYNNIAILSKKTSDFNNAITYFKKVFEVERKGSMPYQIAQCYESLNENQEALRYYIESAVIRKERIGLEHESTIESIENAKRLAEELNCSEELPEWVKFS